MPPRAREPHVNWSHRSDNILLKALRKAQDDGLQSDSGWKTTAWEHCIQACASTETDDGGASKNKEACQRRFASVRHLLLLLCPTQTLFLLLIKGDFCIIETLLQQSGFGWNEEKECVEALDDVWDRYIKAHPKASAWRGKKFPYYENMKTLIVDGMANGENAFAPGTRAAEDEQPAAAAEPLHAESSEDEETSSKFDDSEDNALLKLKRAATTSPPFMQSAKKRCRSGPDAVFSIAHAIKGLKESWVDSASTSQLVPSPVRRGGALKKIFAEVNMSDGEVVSMAKMLCGNTDIADTYMAIPSETRRILYIRSELSDYIQH
ncbi:Myb/SANT-like DNA-binding domain-containing protein [Phanerochaete sordida]|uniref:Myb/SANT-like DNA-binding domain-containing protein n=1 Tax=Phanerochaete sordida TaxID=48140 RepID=A0A9P3GT90_9APHY|nr:Myb/SANT-like DNA-binding domain-containing protein [Phanerochaete sordida]